MNECCPNCGELCEEILNCPTCGAECCEGCAMTAGRNSPCTDCADSAFPSMHEMPPIYD